MSMTIQNVIDYGRGDLADSTKARWPDADLLRYAIEACDTLIDMRQDLLMDDGDLYDYESPSALGSTVPTVIPDSYKPELAHFVCFRAFLNDAEDQGNAALAATHKTQFTSGVLGKE
jgi:hypothetical protein